MTNLNSVLKSRDVTLPTKVHIVKAMVFPAVVYNSTFTGLPKNLPANAGDIRDMDLPSPGQEDPLEEGMAIHSSILSWRIPCTEDPTVHRVTQSQTQLKQLSTHAHTIYCLFKP